MEDSITGRMHEISPRSKSPTPELRIENPGSFTVTKGIRKEIINSTGIARNLAISLRLENDFISFKAIIELIGLSHRNDLP